MAVTDLTDSLPWWTRQGAGPTGGPAAAPQGSGGLPGGVGGQPPPGMNQQAWLSYLMQMFSPGAANAAENNPIATLNSGGTPPVNNTIDTSVVPPAAPPAAPAPGGPSFLPQARGAAVPPGPMTPGTSVLPQGAAQGIQPYGPPMPPGGVAGPLSTGGAGGQGATSNPRFIGIDAPNASPQNSMRSGPQGTALNLAGLFGRGQPAANVGAQGANPNAPAANAQPVSAVRGPLADPTQMNPAALASAVSQPNWWQKFGRPDMTPDQLASAVRKPNWYRNA